MFDWLCFTKIGVLILCDRTSLILSKILGEFFDVFPFALKSVQFMNEVFPLFLEEPELNVSVADAKF